MDANLAPGLIRRLAAISYDLILLFAVFCLAIALILPLNNGEAFTSNNFLVFLYLLSVSFIFYGWFWTHGGQTLGLRAWKIKVKSVDGSAVTWRQALIRFLGAIISWSLLGLGFFWVIFHSEKLAWHDRFSNTRLYFDEQY